MTEPVAWTLKALAMDFLMFLWRIIWGIIKWVFLIGFFTFLIIPVYLMVSTIWDAVKPKRRRRF